MHEAPSFLTVDLGTACPMVGGQCYHFLLKNDPCYFVFKITSNEAIVSNALSSVRSQRGRGERRASCAIVTRFRWVFRSSEATTAKRAIGMSGDFRPKKRGRCHLSVGMIPLFHERGHFLGS